MIKAIKDFIDIHNSPYMFPSCPSCGSMGDYNDNNKRLWGSRGVRFLKALSQELKAEVKTDRNKSGIIDRGYVGGFFSKNGKVVYVSVSDSGCIRDFGEILYRTARDTKDYTGGANNFAKISEEGIGILKGKLAEMLV